MSMPCPLRRERLTNNSKANICRGRHYSPRLSLWYETESEVLIDSTYDLSTFHDKRLCSLRELFLESELLVLRPNRFVFHDYLFWWWHNNQYVHGFSELSLKAVIMNNPHWCSLQVCSFSRPVASTVTAGLTLTPGTWHSWLWDSRFISFEPQAQDTRLFLLDSNTEKGFPFFVTWMSWQSGG